MQETPFNVHHFGRRNLSKLVALLCMKDARGVMPGEPVSSLRAEGAG